MQATPSLASAMERSSSFPHQQMLDTWAPVAGAWAPSGERACLLPAAQPAWRPMPCCLTEPDVESAALLPAAGSFYIPEASSPVTPQGLSLGPQGRGFNGGSPAVSESLWASPATMFT